MEKELRDCEDRIFEAQAVEYQMVVKGGALHDELKRLEERREYHKERFETASQRAEELRAILASQNVASQ